MKKFYCLLIFCFIATGVIYSHPYTNQLEQGQHRASLWANSFSGTSLDTAYTFQANDDGGYDLSGCYVTAYNLAFNTGFSGSYFYYEFGIFDWLSVGTKMCLIDFLVHGFSEDTWAFDASAFLTINFFPNMYILFFDKPKFDFFNVSAEVEVNKAPLFSAENYNLNGYGLFTMYTTLDVGFRFFKKKSFSLTAALDFKYILTVIDQDYGGYLSLDNINTNFDISNITLEYTNGHRFAFCPGLEMNWGHFSLFAGYNFLILDVSKYGSLNYLSKDNISYYFDDNDFFNIEAECVWTF
ncbi:MAG: hypothetical protein PQJ46_14765 [Spirochaetales bacterium]|nr:hypothetical protein [Spirochaetales bacterium]